MRLVSDSRLRIPRDKRSVRIRVDTPDTRKPGKFMQRSVAERNDAHGTSLAVDKSVDDEASITLRAKLVREGGMAILCDIDGKLVWVPRTQLLVGTTVQGAGDDGHVVIPRWLARNLGVLV